MDAKEFLSKRRLIYGSKNEYLSRNMEEYASYKLQEQLNRHLIIGILSGLFVVAACFIGAFIVTSL